jgi:hypothetical protein
MGKGSSFARSETVCSPDLTASGSMARITSGLQMVLLVLGREDNAGETDRLFDRPADVGFGPAGEIFVADGYGNSRVVKFDKHGRFIKAWGKAGTMPGEFDLVHAIVVGEQPGLRR